MTVLVSYATSSGSTRAIAERLRSRLQRLSVPAEAFPVTESVCVDDFDAVILGSEVHGGKWLPEAMRLAHENAELLRHRPVWLFSVSTVGDQESMFPARVARRFRAMRKEPAELTELCAAIHPRGHRNFAGVIGRRDWPFFGRAFFRAVGGRYGDHRNWAAIDTWADSIAVELTSADRRQLTNG